MTFDFSKWDSLFSNEEKKKEEKKIDKEFIDYNREIMNRNRDFKGQSIRWVKKWKKAFLIN